MSSSTTNSDLSVWGDGRYGEGMPGRHIVVRAIGSKWLAAYSDQPADEFEGDTAQSAISALMQAKGRRDPKQSSAEIDIAAMLERSWRLDDNSLGE